MAGLRETKKQQTRRAIADAAATILLEQGLEALTVSSVADAADISVRTFHNYFSSIDEALLEFLRATFMEVADDIRAMPAGVDVFEVFEELCRQGFSQEGVQLRSVASLFALGDALEARNSPPTPHTAELEEAAQPILDAFQERLDDPDGFDTPVIVQALAAVVVHAKRIYQQSQSGPSPMTPEEGQRLARRCLHIVRELH